MQPSRPCSRVHRRDFLAGTALATVPFLANGRSSPAQNQAAGEAPLGVPGPYPGRVIEVRNKGMLVGGTRHRDAVKATLERGMKALTGTDDAVAGWRRFFEPGDIVGIKTVPNGHPQAPTSPELILEVIEGLKSAGVKTTDMFVFDRYRGEFMTAGIHKILPDGVRWGGLTPSNDGSQMLQKFDGFENDPIAGYDPDVFIDMALIHRGVDPKDERATRSHLGRFVTQVVNKLVLLPCLKDHGSAGVTGALKNMSHGLVNNVARSHSSPGTNACNQFIPEVVSHPIIRQKCVLHIMDGTRGIWQGGPFGNNPEWAWEYNALFFATDPVAMDHVEWEIIDAKRKEMGVPGVGAVGRLIADPFQREGFDVRQPQHIELASNLGLGIFDRRSPRGRRFSIDHRVVAVS